MPAGTPHYRRWYAYLGVPSPISLPSSYVYSPTTPTCTSGFILCAIYAIYGGVLPSVVSGYIGDCGPSVSLQDGPAVSVIPGQQL